MNANIEKIIEVLVKNNQSDSSPTQLKATTSELISLSSLINLITLAVVYRILEIIFRT